MTNTQDKTPPVVNLHYDKGELIMKEGDYGISIYKTLKGHVRVLKRTGEKEIPLATLGPGEIFGEMTFLNRLLETRSASVRAVDDVELEVWHPARLSKEYNKMPPMLKYVINQTLNRINRMNKVVSQLEKKREEKEKGPVKDPWASRRKFYRKELDIKCIYRPVGWSDKAGSPCHMTDLSLGGVGMDVRARNIHNFTHDPDDKFAIGTTLPSGKDLNFEAKVRSVNKKSQKSDNLHIGLEFTDLTTDAAKTLGFFLMP